MIFKFIIIVSLTALASACGDGTEIPEITRRSRNYAVSGTETPVSDFLLNEGWYNATGPNGQYMMPDSSSLPPFTGCGTHQPVYIQGTHPEVTSENPVAAVACSRTFFDDCDARYDIVIRNCSGIIQYYLPPTVRYSAYCLDPPFLQGETSFSPAPDNFVPGTITVTPVLLWTRVERGDAVYNSPTLVFKCLFTLDDALLYIVSWYVNGHLHFSYGPTANTENLFLSTDELVQTQFHLGIDLQCGVQASVDESGIPTVYHFSNEFYAGIQVVKSTLNLNSSHTSALVELKTTIPFGCSYLEGTEDSCNTKKLHVQMSNPEYTCGNDGVLAFQRCSTGIDLQTISSTWNANAVYEFTVTSKFDTQESDTYNLYLQTDDSFSETSPHEFFSGQQLQTITVITSRKDGWTVAQCLSHVDPHVTTFDRTRHYESQDRGDYLLYRNRIYQIEVQERTRPCNNNRATCTCSVAIRAGADVFVINRCPEDTKFNEFMWCNDGGSLDVVKNNEYLYTINTPIGTVIKIRLLPYPGYKDFMNIDIYSSPKDLKNTEGLCGYYDGHPANDYRKRDGTEVYIAQGTRNREFTNDWRLLDTENLFDSRNLENVLNWGATNLLICVCKQSFPFLPTGTAAKEESESTCGTTQFIGCFKPKSITDKKCAKVIQGKKRSLSHNFDNIALLLLPQPVVEVDYKSRARRQEESSELEYQLTDDDAIGNCTRIINDSPAALAFPERIEEEQLIDLVDQCVFDVKAANDVSVGYVHADSLNEMLKQMLTYEPTFVENNTESINTFMRQTCLNNCSSRGYCSEEGECVCDSQYHDPDCSLYVRDPVHVIMVPNGGICDTTLGDCRCSWFFTENLLDNFTCKMIRKQVAISGTKIVMDEQSVPGDFDDRFTGQCCWQESRKKRSTDETMLGYEIEMFISNDGTTFGDGQTLYIIDQTCVEVVVNASINENGLSLKTGFCNIGGQCYADSEVMTIDPCHSCSTRLDVYNWTYVCETFPDDSKFNTVLVAVCVTVPIVVIVIAAVVVYCCCCHKPVKNDQAIAPYNSTQHVPYVNKKQAFNPKGINCYTDHVPSLNTASGGDHQEHVYDELHHGTLSEVLRDDTERYNTIDDSDGSPKQEHRKRPQSAETIRGIRIDVVP